MQCIVILDDPVILEILKKLDKASIRLMSCVSPYLRHVIWKYYDQIMVKKMVNIAIESDNIFILTRYLISELGHFKNVIKYTVRHNSYNTLKLLYDLNYEWDSFDLAEAAMFGSLECLNFAIINNCPWNFQATTLAACNGHISCLKCLDKHNCLVPCKSALIGALINGHIDSFNFIFSHVKKEYNDVMDIACIFDRHECLIKMHKKKWTCSPNIKIIALAFKSIHCYKYLSENL